MKRGMLQIVMAALCVALVASCKNDCTQLFDCKACEMLNDDCVCVENPDYGCPPGSHGTYYYGGFIPNPCSCICNYGWHGANCDVRDTTHFVSFRHGSDTAALASATTRDVEVSGGIFGVFPDTHPIDSVLFSIYPAQEGVFPLCAWDCFYLEVVFAGGARGRSIGGTLTLDSVYDAPFDSLGTYPQYRGTFSTNLYLSDTAAIYYLRDGVFNF